MWNRKRHVFIPAWQRNPLVRGDETTQIIWECSGLQSKTRLGSINKGWEKKGLERAEEFWLILTEAQQCSSSAGSQNSQGKPWGSKRGISRNSHKLELKGLDRPPKVQLHNSWLRNLPAPVLASQLKPQCELFLTSLLLAMAWPISGAFSLSPSCFSGLLTKNA